MRLLINNKYLECFEDQCADNIIWLADRYFWPLCPDPFGDGDGDSYGNGGSDEYSVSPSLESFAEAVSSRFI